MIPSDGKKEKKIIYGGKRCVLSMEQKSERLVQDRSRGGKEFQTAGAAKEKERLPREERM